LLLNGFFVVARLPLITRSTTYNTLRYAKNNDMKRFHLLLCRILSITLLAISMPSIAATATPLAQVQVYSPAREQVVTEFPSTDEVRKEASEWLKSITELSAKLKATLPTDGIILKVPLQPALPLHNKWVQGATKEIYLLIPASSPPSLLIFTEEGQTYLFHFKHNLAPFLKKHHLQKYIKKSPSNTSSEQEDELLTVTLPHLFP
jgi:hypothetical protein